MDGPKDDAGFETIDANSRYFLTRDETGFAVWSVGDDRGDPVATFVAEEGAEERASAFLRRRVG